MIVILAFFIATYFWGSISFALLCSKFKGVDLRRIGSGNLGATNVYRAMGLQWAIIVFLLDAMKGAIPVFLAMMFFPEWALFHVAIALVVILGHSFTIFAKFKGGKGAATGLGVLLVLSPLIFVIIAIIAFLIIWSTRYVSVGTIVSAVMLPFLFFIFGYSLVYVAFISIVCAFVIVRHKKNLSRLIKGEENKI